MAKKDLTTKPWERQDDETPKPYEAFCIYRDLGTQRSLSKVSEKLGKSETLISRWSSAYNWVERAAKWDDEQDRVARQEQQNEIKKMRKRHARIAERALAKVSKALEEIRPQDLTPQDVARLMSEASKLERLSRGDVGEVVEERDGGQAAPAVQFYMPANNREPVKTIETIEEIVEDE